MPLHDDDLRAQCAAELIRLSNPGGPLATDGSRATFRLYPDQRLSVRAEIIEAVREDCGDIRSDGWAVIVLAGPPGAGKSTERNRESRAGWLVIDADEIKKHLLTRAIRDGIYADLLDQRLPDGHPLLPAELASLVHTESSLIADEMRVHALRDGENVLIDTTLTWRPATGPGHGARLLDEVAKAGYERVEFLDVEVDKATALQRASDRWWEQRGNTLRTGTGLGGRFVPPSFIESIYLPDGRSASRINAEEAFDSNMAREVDYLRLTLVENGNRSARIKRHGVIEGAAAASTASPLSGLTAPPPGDKPISRGGGGAGRCGKPRRDGQPCERQVGDKGCPYH